MEAMEAAEKINLSALDKTRQSVVVLFTLQHDQELSETRAQNQLFKWLESFGKIYSPDWIEDSEGVYRKIELIAETEPMPLGAFQRDFATRNRDHELAALSATIAALEAKLDALAPALV
jgi:hypothetical protein